MKEKSLLGRLARVDDIYLGFVCALHIAIQIRLCTLTTCALWPYRFGRSPKTEDLEPPTCASLDEGLQGYPITA